MNQERRERNPGPEGRLRRGSLGTAQIVFFVVAAASPLTAVLGGSPGAFAFGNGAGVPGAYLVAGALYLLFAAGFTAMGRFVADAGAFYTYIGRGLGPAAGLSGAFLAVLAYQAAQIAVYALLGLILSQASDARAPWWLCALVAVALVALCGRRNVSFSSRVLAVCLAAELSMLGALVVAVLAHGGGPAGLTLAPFRPEAVFAPGLGAAMVFVTACYIGFEATAIFGEETRDPARDIPRATYAAVVVITLVYAASSWAAVAYHGPDAIGAAAQADPTGVYLAPARALLGATAAQAMDLLLVVSLFACALSLHGAISRYLFSLARSGVGSPVLARIDPVHGTPAHAGATQSLIAGAVLALFALAGQDPFAVVFSWMSALGTLAILSVQILVAVAVVAFFRGRPRGVGLFRRLLAPASAGLGLAACLVLVIANLPLLAGSGSAEVRAFPVIVALVGAAGAVLGSVRRHGGPETQGDDTTRVDSDGFAQ